MESDKLPVIDLPTDKPRTAVKAYQRSSQSLLLDRQWLDSLQNSVEYEHTELSIKLLTAFYLLLHRYTSQKKLAIGTEIFSHKYFQPSVVSLLLEEQIDFARLTLQVKQEIERSREFNTDLTIDRFNFVRVFFQFKSESLESQTNYLDNKKLELDLILEITERSQGLICNFIYNCNLFKAETVTRAIGHWQSLLAGIIAHPTKNINDLPLLTPAERKQILDTWNDTKTEQPEYLCIHQAVEAQCRKTPDKIALVFEGQELTYRELNARAYWLAVYLQELGVKPDVLVGICVERSIEMVVGILAILKAGGAYVPLDPTYPIERLNYMVQDTKIGVLLTQSHLDLDLTDSQPLQTIYLDQWASGDKSNSQLKHYLVPNSLAYVIYTSGSTGKPKGVQIEHRTAINLLTAMVDGKPGITAEDTLLSVTTICFDISVVELFIPLMVGARLILVSRRVAADGRQLCQALTRFEVTLMQATPVTWQLLLASRWQGSPRLKILSGGEPLTKELARQLLPRCAQLWNLYGPTEATIWSSAYRVTSLSHPISIGRPLNNVKYYILDSHLRPLPVGVPGELHIGGDCLARGYLNRSELTAAKFIKDPFNDRQDARLYKTGDLARYFEDGTVDCLGRLDRQVKIRGFRLEIGEIEAIIGQHPNIKEAVVIDVDDPSGNKCLVAYLVVGDRTPLVRELRDFLRQQLPAYMIPSAFVIVDILPQTLNGKIDRLALPPVDWLNRDADDEYVAPRNLLEAKLVEIWEKILQVRPIGINSNFSDLGGNSLLAMNLIIEVERTLQKPLSLEALATLTTVEHMAASLKLGSENKSIFASISPEQSRLLFAIVAGRGGKRNRPDSLMVAVRDRGSKSPIFVFANADEEVTVLAKYVDRERGFYFLESGYYAIEGTNSQIKELAAYHLKDILAVQPQGPYFFCGYSFGGFLAWEICQQLEAMGKPATMLFLLDTFGTQSSFRFYQHIDYTLRTNWNRLIRFLGLTNSPSETAKKLPLHLVRSFAASQDPYKLSPYKLPVTLFVATKASFHSFFSRKLALLLFPKLGWKKSIAFQLKTIKVPGDHFSLLQEPNVRVLATRLNNCLNEEFDDKY